MKTKHASVAAVGAVSGAACGAAWALLLAATRKEIGFAAIGVGYAVGFAVRHAADGERGRNLQWIAVACTVWGLLLGKYFYLAHLVREMAARSPNVATDGIPGWFDPRVFAFFLSVLPRLAGVYEALWLFLASLAAWRALDRAA